MAHTATGGGATLAYLALAAFVVGILALAATNSTVRAGVSSFLSGLRKNPIGTFFYGSEQDIQTGTTPEAQKAPTSTAEEDSFDYSIFNEDRQNIDTGP